MNAYCYFILVSYFITSSNLYEVFTYNHMVLIYPRIHSRVKVAMVLRRSDQSCIDDNIPNYF